MLPSRDLRCFRRSHMSVLPLSENVVARDLSILRILSKRPPIGVMQQTHANLDVYHILYTQSVRASMDSPVSLHIAGLLSLSDEHTLEAT